MKRLKKTLWYFDFFSSKAKYKVESKAAQLVLDFKKSWRIILQLQVNIATK